MTIATAQQLLNQRLHFGDSQQLAALKFLREVSACRERVMKCKHCQGEGLMRNRSLCKWCAVDYDEDVLRAVGIAAE